MGEEAQVVGGEGEEGEEGGEGGEIGGGGNGEEEGAFEGGMDEDTSILIPEKENKEKSEKPGNLGRLLVILGLIIFLLAVRSSPHHVSPGCD